MKLIASMAHKYARPGVEVDDLIQEGYLGLIEAEKRFDKTANTKFTTYAMYWVRKYILQYLQSEYKQTSMPHQFRYKLLDEPTTFEPSEEVEYQYLLDNLMQLDLQDLTIILLRFGLGASEKSTYETIGNYFGKSREWARKRIRLILSQLGGNDESNRKDA